MSAPREMPVITGDMGQAGAAAALRGVGIYVFPLDHPDLDLCAGIGENHNPWHLNDRGKHPAVKWDSGASTSKHSVDYWWAGYPRNVGIHCGKSGLLVVDEDAAGEFDRFAADHGVQIPETYSVTTAKGKHYYFADTEGGALGNKEGAFGSYAINIRSGSGYVVGPGSLHETKVIYTPNGVLTVAPLPSWIADAIRGKRQPTNSDGWELVDPFADNRFQLPDVIRADHRHDTIMRYASSLRARDCPLREAKILIKDAWQRCEQPPNKRAYTLELAYADLEDIYGRYPAGRSEGYQRQGEPPPESATLDGERGTFDNLVAQEVVKIKIRDAAREIVDVSKRPPIAPYDAGTLGEILARPPEPKARIEGLIPWEAGTLVVAQRKTGKTTFNGNLCRSVINGGAFLGCFPVRPVDGNVAILNYEMPAQTLARWYDSMRIPHNRLHMMNLRGRSNPLATEEERAKLAEWLRARDIETIIYDPFGRAYTGKSQNDPGEVGAWLADLDRFTRGEVGAKDLILTAHAGWDGERTRGASALEDWADSIITLTRDKDEDGGGARFVRAIGRDVFLEEDQLRFHSDERYLELARTGSRKATADQRKVDTLTAEILAIVEEKPGLNGTEIESELREAGATFQHNGHRPVLRALVEEGTLAVEPGKNNAKLYKLAQVAQASPELAHGLGDVASPDRPLGGGLTTTNDGSPDRPPNSGLAELLNKPNPYGNVSSFDALGLCRVCCEPLNGPSAEEDCADIHTPLNQTEGH